MFKSLHKKKDLLRQHETPTAPETDHKNGISRTGTLPPPPPPPPSSLIQSSFPEFGLVAGAFVVPNGESLKEPTRVHEFLSCVLQSTFQICYLRRLFPETHFSSNKIKSLENTPVQVLTPSCEESRRLIDWVESGAADAIKRQYLKRLFFGISKDAEGTELIEQYQFAVGYSDDSAQFRMATSVSGKRRSSKGVNVVSADHVRREWLKMLRMLVSLCLSLDDVPAQRYIFMKMTYYDHCPEGYEPPYFIALDPSRVGRFSREPFLMSIGTMKTPYHSAMMRCKTLLDRSEDQEDYDTESVVDEESTEEGTTLITQTKERHTATTVSQLSQDGMCVDETPHGVPKQSPGGSNRSKSIIGLNGMFLEENEMRNGDSVLECLLQRVLDVCRCCSQVHLNDLEQRLADVSKNEILECVELLVKKGVLIRSYRPNTYIVESRHEFFRKLSLSHSYQQESSIEGKMGSNGADSARTDSVIKSRESGCRFQNQGAVDDMKETNAASAMKSLTLSSSGLLKDKHGMSVTNPKKKEEETFSFLPSSQETLNGNGRVRKASFVEDPIMCTELTTKRRCTRKNSKISRMKA